MVLEGEESLKLPWLLCFVNLARIDILFRLSPLTQVMLISKTSIFHGKDLPRHHPRAL